MRNICCFSSKFGLIVILYRTQMGMQISSARYWMIFLRNMIVETTCPNRNLRIESRNKEKLNSVNYSLDRYIWCTALGSMKYIRRCRLEQFLSCSLRTSVQEQRIRRNRRNQLEHVDITGSQLLSGDNFIFLIFGYFLSMWMRSKLTRYFYTQIRKIRQGIFSPFHMVLLY